MQPVGNFSLFGCGELANAMQSILQTTTAHSPTRPQQNINTRLRPYHDGKKRDKKKERPDRPRLDGRTAGGHDFMRNPGKHPWPSIPPTAS